MINVNTSLSIHGYLQVVKLHAAVNALTLTMGSIGKDGLVPRGSFNQISLPEFYAEFLANRFV